MSQFDSAAAVRTGRAGQLARLLATGEESARLWAPEELAALFRHQLSAPIAVDLGTLDARTAERVRTLSETQGLLLKSFRDLFQHPAPACELLALVKDFAKANLEDSARGLPKEVATGLYYLSIAAALVRLDARITQLPDADLARGLAWAIGQPWLDDESRALLVAARARAEAGAAKGPRP
jgi:hypothetical protein